MQQAQQPSKNEIPLLKRTLELAANGSECGHGGPFGALVEKGGQIIAEAWNTVVSKNDPTAHAEVNAIRLACEKLGAFYLEGCTLYASSEPCPMCLSAAYWAHVDKIVFANSRSDAASIGFSDEALYTELALPISDRQIPTVHVQIEGSAVVMKNWAANSTKVPY